MIECDPNNSIWSSEGLRYRHQPWEDEQERLNRLRAKVVGALANAQLLKKPINWLKERAANDDHWAVRQAAVQDLARGWKDDPDTLPLLKDRAANDDNWDVRQAAVQELARGWKDDPDTLPLLKDRAANDDNWDVRQAAVQELARGWKDDPETMVWLKELPARNDA